MNPKCIGQECPYYPSKIPKTYCPCLAFGRCSLVHAVINKTRTFYTLSADSWNVAKKVLQKQTPKRASFYQSSGLDNNKLYNGYT